ncbi:MAG: type II secretion system protein GspD [Planctomycetes bacterium]|nr:type II secretion system protein GspD [Planctomycetota bacterium]
MNYEQHLIMKMKTEKSRYVLRLIVLVIAVIALFGGQQGPMTAHAEPNSIEGIEISYSQDETIQSISFKRDVGIRDALAFLAAKYQKNIVPSPSVDGKLAFTNLYNVTFDEAMDAILGVDYRYQQKGNLIKVYTAVEFERVRDDVTRMSYKVFILEYISAAEARKLVSPLLSANGKIEVTSPADVGVPIGNALSTESKAGDSMAVNDIIIVRDYPEYIKEVENVIKVIDIRPKQVLIEATILSAKLTEEMDFGINWQTLKGTITSVPETSGLSDYISGTVTPDITGSLTVGLTIGDVGVFLEALEEITDITILANPKIMAVNKQLGQVYIGKKIGYREGDTFDTSGNLVEGEVKFLETGTKLSFRPYILGDSYIRMDIHPKDSTGNLVGTDNLPEETSAELSTNIIVKDGQTIVIGGLFRDKVTSSRTQIPILGDLPLIGPLFRGVSDDIERQEVIVMLTPHIIREPQEAGGEERAKDAQRKRQGAKEGLSWLSVSRLVEDRYAYAVNLYLDKKYKAALTELAYVLNARPGYLEAIRLRERIIIETTPDGEAKLERNVLDKMDRNYSNDWLRR